MANCAICDTKLKFTNTPTFKAGVLTTGETICQSCLMKTLDFDKKVKQMSLEELKIKLADKEITEQENKQETQARVDRIQEQIKNSKTPNATNFFGRKEVEELPKLIQENETITALIQGSYNNGTGLLVLSDKRLIFIDKGFVNLKTEDFPLNKISSVQFESGMVFAKIKIHTSSNIAEISNIDKNFGRQFVDLTRSNIEGSEGGGGNSSGQPDVLEQIKKLSELKDQGILTEEEFNNKKTDLLSKL